MPDEHTSDPIVDSFVVLGGVLDILMDLTRLKYLPGFVPGTYHLFSLTHLAM